MWWREQKKPRRVATGYWLLGTIIEHVTRLSYPDYERENILRPLGLSAEEIDFVIPDPSRHANGHLSKTCAKTCFIKEGWGWGLSQRNVSLNLFLINSVPGAKYLTDILCCPNIYPSAIE